PPNPAWDQRDARRRRIVEDDEPIGDAARLPETLLPVAGVEQHARAHADIERPGFEVEGVRVALDEVDLDDLFGGTAARLREQHVRRVDRRDEGGPGGERNGRAAE